MKFESIVLNFHADRQTDTHTHTHTNTWMDSTKTVLCLTGMHGNSVHFTLMFFYSFHLCFLFFIFMR